MSKRALFITFAVFVLGIGIGVLVSSQKKLPISSKPAEVVEEATSAAEVIGAANEKTVVTRVIDGDTIELSDGRKVRYIGIDTPETVDPRKTVQCFGKEAAEKNKEWVLGKEVMLEKDISEVDRYGRLLRYVYVRVGETELMVNEGLVREGFAQASSYPPDVKYQERLRLAEQDAREVGRGLWSECPVTTTTFPTSLTSPDTTEVRGTTETKSEAGAQSSVPSGCVIKGNISSSGEKIYHLPGCGSYAKTSIDEARGERWFCTEEEAVSAGWRKAKNC